MKKFLVIVLSLIRLFIMGKMIFLLYKSSVDEINYPLDKLTWWVYYLIFDVWVAITFNLHQKVDEDQSVGGLYTVIASG